MHIEPLETFNKLGQPIGPPKTQIELSRDLLSEKVKSLQPNSLSKFFTEEIEFFSQFWKENNGFDDGTLEGIDNAEDVDLPLPADNYFIYKKLKSTPDEKIKHEFMFLINIFSVYLQESVEDILKVASSYCKSIYVFRGSSLLINT